MKLLIFAPYGWASGQQEVALELYLVYRERGYEVHVVECRRENKACDLNPFNKWERCFECQATSAHTWDTVGLAKSQRHALNIENLIEPSEIPNFNHIDELKNYKWKGLPAGVGVATSAISAISRDSEPDLQKNRSFVVKGIQTFVNTYAAISKHMDELKPDLFFCFNGRNVTTLPAFLAARERNIEVLVGERDYYKKYVLFKNAHAVDLPYVQSEIARAADRMATDPEGENISADWYRKNAKGNEEALCNYVADQTEGKLPANFDTSKHNIVIFPSSEDEISAAPGWENPFFYDQDEGYRYILSKVQDPSIHFYLRSHPHLKGIDCAQNRKMATLAAPNLTIIPPESEVDTYALMRTCSKVITFGSTTGIEACYWERPTILAGRAYYEKSGAAHIPRDKEQLIEMIVDKNLPAKEKKLALAYGYWWKTRETALRFIDPADPSGRHHGSYQGKPLTAPASAKEILRWYHRLMRIKRILTRWMTSSKFNTPQPQA